MFKKSSVQNFNRRNFLKTAFAGVLTGAHPSFALGQTTRKAAETLVAQSGLSGAQSIVVMDAQTGRVLESFKGSKTLPPASTAKAATALYSLHALGSEAAFQTRLIATGPVSNGVLQGDLILAGGGDPRLDTDALGDLAVQLKKRGVQSIKGKFYVYGDALPYQRVIDTDQPDHVGYNPTIHGLNLNFNRVFFQWKRGNSGYGVSMLARAKNYAPAIKGIKMAIRNRDLPVFSYRSVNGQDNWTVARSALGKGGSRWLPVRKPVDYAGEAFRAVAAYNGIKLPQHKVTTKKPAGTVLAAWTSAKVGVLVKSMIKYSTNMTAETLGLNASLKRGKSVSNLKASANAMSSWLKDTYGMKSVKFVDHSGLGDDSRVSAHEMARLLVNARWDGPLRPVMKDMDLRNSNWKKAPIEGTKIVVKTGTLNFASALVGYVSCPNGRKLAFAILTADMPKRSRIPKKDRERPAGAKTWARKSRILQHQLIRSWVETYG